MTTPSSPQRITIAQLQQHKKGGKKPPLVCLTAATYPIAHIIDPHCDVILVGDSLGMTLYGMDSTHHVTIDMMSAHGQAVMRASTHACVIIDMPASSCQSTPQHCLNDAQRLLHETHACAVKIEGGAEATETIALLCAHHIPVMGHIGLMPQYVSHPQDYRVQGRNASEEKKIIDDAIAVEKAGAFAVVIESCFEHIAHHVTERLTIPTIGIGASYHCDGQILVTEDMIGLYRAFSPQFVRHYAQISDSIDQAVRQYAHDVRHRQFPEKKHCYDRNAPPHPKT
ncbi:MAG: 3-methyl-2-oxobutanoate hydroxymethyltransferase [Alphaproteobacteria bacterium GM7ARS4]|nr:3-methyl-2-oxobutanoate hydroxymethyltransferase [Alphaproteobacteria bacterium GM7ARS4]